MMNRLMRLSLMLSLAAVCGACGLVKVQTSGGGTELAPAGSSKPKATVAERKPPTRELPDMVDAGDDSAELSEIRQALEQASDSFAAKQVAYAEKRQWTFNRHEVSGAVISRSKLVWAFYEVEEDRLKKQKQKAGECYYQLAQVGQENTGPDTWDEWAFFFWVGAPVLVECDVAQDAKLARYFGDSAK